MKEKSLILFVSIITLILFSVINTLAGEHKDNKGIKLSKSEKYTATTSDASGKVGDAYRLFINNVNIPMNRTGVIADVYT